MYVSTAVRSPGLLQVFEVCHVTDKEYRTYVREIISCAIIGYTYVRTYKQLLGIRKAIF